MSEHAQHQKLSRYVNEKASSLNDLNTFLCVKIHSVHHNSLRKKWCCQWKSAIIVYKNQSIFQKFFSWKIFEFKKKNTLVKDCWFFIQIHFKLRLFKYSELNILPQMYFHYNMYVIYCSCFWYTYGISDKIITDILLYH